MDPEQRLAEALRAKAAGGAGHGGPGPAQPVAGHKPPGWPRREVVVSLAVALVVGVLLGVAIGVVSVLFPGLLPMVG